jgi:hypothetical protein
MSVNGQVRVVKGHAAGPAPSGQPVRADRVGQGGKMLRRAAQRRPEPTLRDVFDHDAVVDHVVLGKQRIREQRLPARSRWLPANEHRPPPSDARTI